MESKFFSRYWIWVIFCLVPCISYAAALSFEDYKVSEVYSGQHHRLITAGQVNKNWIEGRKNALLGPVNFAGHYVIYTDGCGGGTVCGEILDVRTGEVVESLPNAYYIDGEDGAAPFAAASNSDSRLLIIVGVAADPEVGLSGEELNEGNRQRYYEFVSNKLRLIKIIDK